MVNNKRARTMIAVICLLSSSTVAASDRNLFLNGSKVEIDWRSHLPRLNKVLTQFDGPLTVDEATVRQNRLSGEMKIVTFGGTTSNGESVFVIMDEHGGYLLSFSDRIMKRRSPSSSTGSNRFMTDRAVVRYLEPKLRKLKDGRTLDSPVVRRSSDKRDGGTNFFGSAVADYTILVNGHSFVDRKAGITVMLDIQDGSLLTYQERLYYPEVETSTIDIGEGAARAKARTHTELTQSAFSTFEAKKGYCLPDGEAKAVLAGLFKGGEAHPDVFVAAKDGRLLKIRK